MPLTGTDSHYSATTTLARQTGHHYCMFI